MASGARRVPAYSFRPFYVSLGKRTSVGCGHAGARAIDGGDATSSGPYGSHPPSSSDARKRAGLLLRGRPAASRVSFLTTAASRLRRCCDAAGRASAGPRAEEHAAATTSGNSALPMAGPGWFDRSGRLSYMRRARCRQALIALRVLGVCACKGPMEVHLY
nr:uncharacterized protein LOC117850466 [Setaria viridis]